MRERRPDETGIEEITFLVDRMLGTLARNLRMLGFDAEYAAGGSPQSLLKRAMREGQWFITRRLLPDAKGAGVPMVKINHDQPDRQVIEVLRYLPNLPGSSRWFSRCIRCNRILDSLSWEEAQGLVPEYIALTHRHFRRCPSCGRVFWPGTHRFRMQRAMESWLNEAQEGAKREQET